MGISRKSPEHPLQGWFRRELHRRIGQSKSGLSNSPSQNVGRSQISLNCFRITLYGMAFDMHGLRVAMWCDRRRQRRKGKLRKRRLSKRLRTSNPCGLELLKSCNLYNFLRNNRITIINWIIFWKCEMKIADTESWLGASSNIMTRIFFRPNSMNISMHYFLDISNTKHSFDFIRSSNILPWTIISQFNISKRLLMTRLKIYIPNISHPNSIIFCMHGFIHIRKTNALHFMR